jgi:hypothetical protein
VGASLSIRSLPKLIVEEGVKTLLPRLPSPLGAAVLRVASHWSSRLGRLGFRPDGPPAGMEHFVRHRCIFVHIPKCAGTSVIQVLSDQPVLHWKLSYYRLVFPPEQFTKFFKFTFVRNPWDRLVSGYHYLCDGGSPSSQSDRNWSKREIYRYANFEDFVLRGLPRFQVRRWLTFVPQHEFVTLPWRRGPQLDFVGKVENMDQDWGRVAERLGLPPTLPNHNKGKREADYRSYYTPQSRAMAGRIYAEDIKMFGYEF